MDVHLFDQVIETSMFALCQNLDLACAANPTKDTANHRLIYTSRKCGLLRYSIKLVQQKGKAFKGKLYKNIGFTTALFECINILFGISSWFAKQTCTFGK